MMDLKESSISATFSSGSCAAIANFEPNQRQNIPNSSAAQLNTATATPVISLFKLKNFLYQPKFKSLLSTDGKGFCCSCHLTVTIIIIIIIFCVVCGYDIYSTVRYNKLF
jgi:hypothetical protein